MAKRRFKRAKASFRSFKKSYRKQGTTANLMTTIVAAGVYGAVRPRIEAAIAPYTANVPILGSYTDEVALGAVGYMLAKGKMPFFKGKMAKSVGQAVLIVEATRIGSGLSQGLTPSSNAVNQGW